MNHENYFSELSRVLRKEGIETGIAEKDRFPVLMNGRPVFQVEAGGVLSLTPDDVGKPDIYELYHQVAPIAAEVHEYMTVMDNSARLYADSLDDEFKLLANYNGVVLAGRQMEKDNGYKFVTWQWNHDRTGVTLGHNFIDDYAAAKQEFAIRSGLILKDKLFTPEQLTSIYSCIDGILEGTLENYTFEEEKELQAIRDKIVDIVPDLDERIANVEQENKFLHQSM
jgi:hypothetical protein